MRPRPRPALEVMLDTGSPPCSELEPFCSVSHLSHAHYGSRPSFLKSSSFDGHLLNHSPLLPPSRPRSTPPVPAMTHPPSYVQISKGHGSDSSLEEATSDQKILGISQRDTTDLRSNITSSAPGIPQDIPSLAALTLALNHQTCQKSKAKAVQDQLHRTTVISTRIARLQWKLPSARFVLSECLRLEDKQSFSVLFNTLNDALDSVVQQQANCARESPTTSQDEPRPSVGFLDQVSPHARETIIEFCVRLKSEHDFIADRLVQLSYQDLLAILPDRSAMKATDAVFGNASTPSPGFPKPAGYLVDKQIDFLSADHFSSPLETLVNLSNIEPANGPGFGRRVTSVWATACARLLIDQKPGSERLIPAVLDIWSAHCLWPGKDHLESWLIDLLQKGNFLLEQPAKQSFSMHIHARQNGLMEDHTRIESFYSEAVDSFFDLVGNATKHSIIPQGALDMCHAISAALEDFPSRLTPFPYFVATRWLFSSFFHTLLVQPEGHDLLVDRYISNVARQKILREVANRCQKMMLDVAYQWKYRNSIRQETVQRVQRAVDRLRPVRSNKMAQTASLKLQKISPVLAICSNDILVAMNALNTSGRPASSDRDTLRSGVHSSASSLSGFSLFQSPSATSRLNQQLDTTNTMNGIPRKISDDTSLGQDSIKAGEEDLTNNAEVCKETQRMREAYIEVEEFYLSHRPRSTEQWAVLLCCDDGSKWQTINERVRDLRSTTKQLRTTESHGASSKFESYPDRLIPGSAAVETLLRHAAQCGVEAHMASQHDENVPLDWKLSIESMFSDFIQVSKDSFDFFSAHTWTERKADFESALLEGSPDTHLDDVLSNIYIRSKLSGECSTAILDDLNTTLPRAKHILDRASAVIPSIRDVCTRLRDKMWYVMDVRTSAAYDEARSVAIALRVMGKVHRQDQNRTSQSIRYRNTPRASSTSAHLKTEAQILELMAAAPQHGGPNKLGDDQSRLTSQWMEVNSIENFCKGEERLHKLCMVVRRCTEQVVGVRPAENPLLWPSILFARDRQLLMQGCVPANCEMQPSLSILDGSMGRPNRYKGACEANRGVDSLSNASQPLSGSSSREFFEARSPTLTTRSSGTLWSPPGTEYAPSSATSVASHQAPYAMQTQTPAVQHIQAVPSPHAYKGLRQNLLSLLLSDISQGMYDDGSETDLALWRGLGGQLTRKALSSSIPGAGSPVTVFEGHVKRKTPRTSHFDFNNAFVMMMQRFSRSLSTDIKLGILLDIQNLIQPYMEYEHKSRPVQDSTGAPVHVNHANDRMQRPLFDLYVDGFKKVFSNEQISLSGIFRDFQYIAALTPLHVLENTPQGKAFWNAGIALSSIKYDAFKYMVETADSIIAYHTNNRGHGRSPSTQQQQRDSAIFSVPSRTPSAEDIAHYTMADAAYLLQITAREGDPAAQRELATLYLTHPELMGHIIAPFTRPRDVFKEELQSKWKRNQDPSRCDPGTMCVAHHWMSMSNRGGDGLAKEFLRQREEMDRLP